jgi:hypothetical protein
MINISLLIRFIFRLYRTQPSTDDTPVKKTLWQRLFAKQEEKFSHETINILSLVNENEIYFLLNQKYSRYFSFDSPHSLILFTYFWQRFLH